MATGKIQFMKAARLSRKNAIYTPRSATTVMVSYSPAQKILEIEFKGGRVYHYLEVKPGLWKTYRSVILAGGSSGKFVNTHIKPFYDNIGIE